MFFLRRILALTLFAGLMAGPAHAQEETSEPGVPVDGTWDTSLTGKLAGSQAAYRNWQEGGLNTLALTTSLDGKAVKGTANWIQTYEMRLAFGLIQQDTLNVRKAEDLIRLNAGLQYRGSGLWRRLRPTIAAGLRTQFAAGFNYDKDPLGLGRDLPVKTSEFFSPAVLTQSLGLTYAATEWLSTRFGVAGKETVVLEQKLRPIYDVDRTQAVRAEGGLELETTVDRVLAENIRYQSRLNLFQTLTQREPVDVLWENVVTMQVNSWMNVNFEYVMLYDANIIDAVQIKEVLSVGIAFSLL